MSIPRGKRLLSGLLAAAIVAGLFPALPGLLIPAAAAADTDAYGFELETPSSFNPNDGQNPYGTGKFNFNPIYELNVYEGLLNGQNGATYDLDSVNNADSLFNGMNSNTLGNTLTASRSYSTNNSMALVNGVAFDPTGSGRDDHIMYYGFDTTKNNKPSSIVTKADAETLPDPQVVGAEKTPASDDWAGEKNSISDNAFTWVSQLERSRGTGYTALAAGDFDGDGKDTVIYYIPGDTNNGGWMTLQEQTFNADGSKSENANLVLNVGRVRMGTEGTAYDRAIATIQQWGTKDSQHVMLNTAMVHLSAADTDADGSDELIVTISLGNMLNESQALDDRSSRLMVLDYDGETWTTTFSQQLSGVAANDPTGSVTGTYYLRSASTKAGDIDGDGVVELVTLGSAGYQQSNNLDSVANTYELAVITRLDGGKYTVQKNDEGSIVGHVLPNQTSGDWIGFWDVYASNGPQSLALVAFDGFGTQEYIVARGKIFRYNTDNGSIELVDIGDNYTDYNMYAQASQVTDPIVGNFDGNAAGREQVFFAVELNRASFTFRVCGLRYNGEESLATDTGNLQSSSRQINASSWLQSMICLVAVDMDTNDGMIAEYKSKEYTYTDPEVMAVLEASPYFGDLRDKYADLPGSTSFGLGQGSGSAESETATTTAGAYLSFDYDVTIFGVPVASMEMEAAYESQWDKTTEIATTYSTSMDFNTGPFENQVVILRTPVIVYHYKVWDTDGNESEMHVTTAQQPVYTSMTLEDYNEVAEATGGDVIGSDIISCEPGVPSSYRSSMSEFSSKAKRALETNIAASSADSGSTELTVTREDSTTVTSSVTHSISTKAGAGVGGLTIGASGGTASGSGKSETNISSITQSGEVAAIPAEYRNIYGFNWNLVTWDATLGSGEDSYTVPVVSYLVTNVVEPVSVPQNVYADSSQDGTAVNVSWEKGYKTADSYEVYRYLGGSAPNPYYLIGTVDGNKAQEDGTYLFTDSNVQPGEEYEYSVRAVGTDGSVSNYSAPVSVWTASKGVITFTMMPEDAAVLPGSSAQFHAEANAPSGVTLSMIWQVREEGSSAWTNLPGTAGNTLTLNNVTTDMDGNQYRLLATAMQGDDETSYLYSSPAKLSVGKVPSEVTVSAEGGNSGKASYIEQQAGKPVEQTVNKTFKVDGDSYTRYVYESNLDTQYVYVKSDGSYYLLNGYTFSDPDKDGVYESSGNGSQVKLTSLSGVLMDASDKRVASLDELHSTIQDTETIGDATYHVFTAEGYAVSGDPEDRLTEDDKTTLTLYQKQDDENDKGFYVQLEGDFNADGSIKLTKVEQAAENTIKNLTYDASTLEKVWSDEADQDENQYLVYQIGNTNQNVYVENDDTAIRYWVRDEQGDYNALTLLGANDLGVVGEDGTISNRVQLGAVETTEITTTPTVEELVSGDKVALNVNVSNTAGAAVSGIVDFTIMNNATGAKSGGGTATIENDAATLTWTPPEPGVYTITAAYQGNDQLRPGNATMTFYAYGAKKEGYELTEPQSLVYGDKLTFTVNQWTIAENGDKTEVQVENAGFEAYAYDSEKGAYSDTPVKGWTNGGILTPGSYRIVATQGDAEIASKQITVAKRQLTVSVPEIKPIDIKNLESYDWNNISLKFGGLLNADDDYKKLFTLDTSSAENAAAAGTYALPLTVNTGDDYAGMTEKYIPTLQSGSVRITADEYAVTYSVNGSGSLTVRNQSTSATEISSGALVPAGTTITFTATPDAGYAVSSWTINGQVWTAGEDGTKNGITVDWESNNQLRVENLQQDINVIVQFGSGKHTVTYEAEDENGEITAQYRDAEETSPITVVDGSTVVFNAKADTDYTITRWTVNGEVQENADGSNYRDDTLYVYNIREDTNVTVAFAEYKELSVTYSKTGNGEISANVTNDSIVHTGDAVTFTATPATGNMIAKWTVNGASVDRSNMDTLGVSMEHPLSNELTVPSVTGDLKVEVEFASYEGFALPEAEAGVYTISSDVTIIPASDNGMVQRGGDVTFTVVPVEGVAITTLSAAGAEAQQNEDGSWVVTIKDVQHPIELVMDTSVSIPLTIDDPENGSVTVTRGGETLSTGSTVLTGDALTISAQADSGYRLDSLTVNGADFTSGSTFTIPDDAEQVTITATFAQQSSGGGGGGTGGGGGGAPAEPDEPDVSVDGAGGKADVEGGTVIITPDEGYEISGITVNGEAVDIPADGKLTRLDEDDEVVVTFRPVSDEPGSNPFADVSDAAWYADAVAYVYDKGMMNGVSETSFAPNDTTNRAMIVTMLYRLEGEPDAAASAFTDVAAGSYYADAVAWAQATGIVTGISDTVFAPDNSITREQLAAILYRYASFKGYDVSSGGMSLAEYEDVSRISSYAVTAMQWANENGLITGVTDTVLDPKGNATRAQVATILMRFCEQIAEI